MPRLLLALSFLAFTTDAVAAEPWADPKLPVADGLALWLDASRIDAAAKGAKEKPAADGKLAIWLDGSGNKRHVRQAVSASQPMVVKAGESAIVRFDGDDDHFRFTGGKEELGEFTTFLVVAPRRNLGGFQGFLAFNAPNSRDYETGLNIDMGPNGSGRFTDLNVEAKGTEGWRNLMKPGGDFGKLYLLEVKGAEKAIRLFVNGVANGQREWANVRLSFAEITVGARYYTNGPGAQQVRGSARCDIAEVLVFNRALADEESKKVRAYLDAKHAALRQNLPPDGPANGIMLESVADPPPVQMLLPGFTARQLPLDLTNINNVKYRPDGTLVALAYNGDIWLLTDTDRDGLEDKAEVFFESKGQLKSPIGMGLTPPNYKHGQGVFVASKGKISLIVDTNGDNKADKETVIAEGWKELPHGVDALGVAYDPKDGSVYFGLGTTDFTNAYQVGKDGKASYSLKDERGTISRIAPDFKSREIVATGIRFPVGIRMHKNGDLFCSDQEGATWLPNGNPFDELLHIQKGRHYGFPPRHPKHLPDVIDEPSTFDYGPQHQSTCGFCFNEPVKEGGPTFGPAAWAGDVIMTGESRGKLHRTQLVKTDAGYVARSQLIACLNMLTIDCCVAPDGSLVVACHSGPPDWGTGPLGKGKLFKISYTNNDHPQPVFAWPAGPREVRIEFDRPVDPQLLRDVLAQTKITAGRFVRAGDRFTSLWPPYAVVAAERTTPRFNVRVHSAQLLPDRRTLVLATDPLTAAVHYGVTLPGMGRPTKVPKGELSQHAAIDLDFDLSGVEATWTNKNKEVLWRGWLPSLDLAVSRKFTAGSAYHDLLWKALEDKGRLSLNAQLNLTDMLRPAVQPGAKIDYEWPREEVMFLVKTSKWEEYQFLAPGSLARDVESKNGTRIWAEYRPEPGQPVSITVKLADCQEPGVPRLAAAYSTKEDQRERPFPLHRALLPWADTKADLGKPVALARPKELEGGSWARGRKVFFSDAASCYKCHGVHGQGGQIGPDLTNLIHRDYASVYRDVTSPSFALNPDFITQTVTLTDERVLTGVVRTEGAKLHIGDKDGKVYTVDRAEVASMRPSAISVMPDDLVRKLGPEHTRDLLTFLLTPPPSMPRDYVGAEKRPKPRTVAEVNAVLSGAPNPPEKTRPIRVVLVDGPKDHGLGEHDYPVWKKAWAELLSAADNIEVVTAHEWPAKEEFQKADAMVFYQFGDWNAARAADIDAFLERGGGVSYIHWAVAGRKDVPGFAKRIGLAAQLIKFRHGPLDLEFNTANKHPIARNLDKLKMVDESYWKMTGELPKERVIAWGQEDGEPQPLFWSLEHGKGRVFVSIPGHYSWSFDDPLFRVLLLRGLAWTAREPVDRFNDLVWPGADVAR